MGGRTSSFRRNTFVPVSLLRGGMIAALILTAGCAGEFRSNEAELERLRMENVARQQELEAERLRLQRELAEREQRAEEERIAREQAEAAAQARIEAERRAREAEERARQEAEARARAEAQARARAEAEAQEAEQRGTLQAEEADFKERLRALHRTVEIAKRQARDLVRLRTIGGGEAESLRQRIEVLDARLAEVRSEFEQVIEAGGGAADRETLGRVQDLRGRLNEISQEIEALLVRIDEITNPEMQELIAADRFGDWPAFRPTNWNTYPLRLREFIEANEAAMEQMLNDPVN